MRFIDANVFVYVLAPDPEYGPRARSILERVEQGESAATSTLVIGQVCAYLARRRRADVIPDFLRSLQSLPGLEKAETTYQDFMAASELQETVGFPWAGWADLVIAAQMRRLAVKEIYSNDKDFDRLPGVKRLF